MKLNVKKRENSLSAGQQQMASNIAMGIVARQRKLADWINKRTGRLSARHWLWLLVLFCVLFGGYSLYLLVSAFG